MALARIRGNGSSDHDRTGLQGRNPGCGPLRRKHQAVDLARKCGRHVVRQGREERKESGQGRGQDVQGLPSASEEQLTVDAARRRSLNLDRRKDRKWKLANWVIPTCTSRRWASAPGPSAARAGSSPGDHRTTTTPSPPFIVRSN